ncbi:MAG: NAD(+) synthase, partial [candidate division Zixibacteria bacterium]|nr:NAD(+) synthase [candidate division Zixibacteria bacterium]
MEFNKNSLGIDAAKVADHLSRTILTQIGDLLKKGGAVVGISGGIDSSVVAALCARALGPKKVVGIMMPETDSSPDSATLASELAAKFGFETITENITGGLAGMGCYQRRDEAMRLVFPEFDSTWKAKIVNPGNIMNKGTF